MFAPSVDLTVVCNILSRYFGSIRCAARLPKDSTTPALTHRPVADVAPKMYPRRTDVEEALARAREVLAADREMCGVITEADLEKESHKRRLAAHVQARKANLSSRLELNVLTIDQLGLPLLSHPSADATLPSWLREALQGRLLLRARIVDYWAPSHVTSSLLADSLRHLGFKVAVDTSRRQPQNACSFVAARVINDLHSADGAWWTRDVRRAASAEWVRRGNSLLGRNEQSYDGARDYIAAELTARDMTELVRGFWQGDAPSDPNRVSLSTWLRMPFALSLDAFTARLATELWQAAMALQSAPPSASSVSPLQLCVVNTATTASKGEHWFTIAYSIEDLRPRSRDLQRTRPFQRERLQTEKSCNHTESAAAPVGPAHTQKNLEFCV